MRDRCAKPSSRKTIASAYDIGQPKVDDHAFEVAAIERCERLAAGADRRNRDFAR